MLVPASSAAIAAARGVLLRAIGAASSRFELAEADPRPYDRAAFGGDDSYRYRVEVPAGEGKATLEGYARRFVPRPARTCG